MKQTSTRIHTTNLSAPMRLRMWQKALPEITNCSGQLGECATG